jgi:2-polyprenyl-3-methyl-5-hydroxy-6-metoxy-1,4-benzoquinol methylase
MRLPYLPSTVNAARLPDWDLGRRVRRACPVCGGDDAEPFCRRPDDLEVVRCRACEMMYVLEVPDEAALGAFYARYAEWKGYERVAQPPRWWRVPLDAMRDANVRILEETGGLAGRRVLEIGASYGQFLERVRWKGARVEGVELDQAARAFLTSREIVAYDQIPAGERYDVVCAFQLLEHLSDPQALAKQIAAALDRDGRLLLGVPNAAEVDVVGATWVGFRVDLEHVNYFSARTLGRLLAAHGLYVEQFWCTSQPAIGRPVESNGSRTQRWANWLSGRVFAAGKVARDGSYNLTLLARRA